MKVGDKVYYSVYEKPKTFFGNSPKIDNIVGRIETISIEKDLTVLTLDNEPYVLAVEQSKDGKIYKGQAMKLPIDSIKDDKIIAFVSTDYISYMRESVLYYKELLQILPKTEKDWFGNINIGWEYSLTLAALNKLLKTLEPTYYFNLYPEDLI